jgi:hypothetical protein
MTITLHWWMLPLALVLIPSVILGVCKWIDLKYGDDEPFCISLLFLAICALVSLGIIFGRNLS